MSRHYHHGDLKAAAIKSALIMIQNRNEVNFTIREISNELKVSPTALYRHFQSKSDLIAAIAEEGFLRINQVFAQEKSKSQSADDQLWDLGFGYIQFALNNPGHYRAMFHQDLICDPETSASLSAAGEQAFLYLLNTIEEGMTQQVFKKTNAMQCARTIWAAVHGFATLLIDGQFKLLENEKEIQKSIKQHLDLILKILL